MVLTLSSSEKLNAGRISILALFDLGLESSANGQATNITLEGWEPVLLEVAKMTLIVSKGGFEEASLWDLDPVWPLYPLDWCRNCFNFPSLTSCSRWFHKILQSSVVCPRSWRYWQWSLWLRFIGSLPILFGHLKYCSFLIFSKTWCTWFLEYYANHLGSNRPWLPRKVSLGAIIIVFVRPEISLILMDNLCFPFPYYWSSSTSYTHLYGPWADAHFLQASWSTTFSNHARHVGRPWKFLWPHHQSPHQSHWTSPSTCLCMFSESPLLEWS